MATSCSTARPAREFSTSSSRAFPLRPQRPQLPSPAPRPPLRARAEAARMRPKTSPPPGARLFSEAHPAAPPPGIHVANIDGASRGNPGPAAYAVVIRDPAGKIALELAKNIGRETNNV